MKSVLTSQTTNIVSKGCLDVRVAINADLGEGYGRWDLGADDELMQYISAANIACGMHAGDPPRMAKTVALAQRFGVGIGAHPSYPDLQGFGRRFVAIEPGDLRDFVTYQVGALMTFVKAAGAVMEHVKPHGALFNRAAEDEATARAVVEGVRRVDPDLILVVLAGSVFEEVALSMGAPVAREVFADRAYDRHGRLVPRSQPGSVITDPTEAARRAWLMVSEGRVQAVTGEWVNVQADTICVHSDTPGAVHIARAVRETLERRGVAVVTTRAKLNGS